MIDYIKIKNDEIKLNLNKFGSEYNISNKKDGSKNYKFKIYIKELLLYDESDEGEDDVEDIEQKYSKHDSALILIANSRIGFTLQGSLRRWWYGAASINADLNFIDFCKCIKLLSKKIGVKENDLWNSRVSTVEIGGNLKLKPKYKNIIGAIESYPKRTRFGDRKHTVYFHKKNKSEEIIFYDKVTQLYRREKKIIGRVKNRLLASIFVLRFEIKINTPSKTEYANYINSLKKIRDNWETLIDKWEATFGKVEIIFQIPPKLPKGKTHLNRTDLKNYFIQLGMYNYGGIESVDNLIMGSVHKTKTDDEKKHFRTLITDNIPDNLLDYIEEFITVIKGKADKMKKGYFKS